ncbi:HET-domain-containing protein [Nemania abortiva]|nr:HET-domain-containing protein [Nemania abortiva]
MCAEMAQKLCYSPLLNQHDIRVIRLLTQADHPDHATGPVHCRIVHVPLEKSYLIDNAGSITTKGSNGSWPVNVVGAGDNPNEFDALFERGFLERYFPVVRIPEWRHLATPNFAKRATSKANRQSRDVRWDQSQDIETNLPWRYTWGDFVALSYVWGNPLAAQRVIYVDDVPVSVTANLEAALRELRNHSRIQQGFMVWVDALCINQVDLDERAAQVARMKEIYRAAWHVIIWLGPEENDSDLAILALRYMSLQLHREDALSNFYRRVEFYVVRLPFMQWQHAHTALRIRKAALYAIYHFLARSYWRRLWIMQEVALGKRNSPVLCGNSSILLADILRALQVMKLEGGALGQYTIFSAKGMGEYQKRSSLTTKDTYDISEKLWERPLSIAELQLLHTQGPAGHSSLYDVLLLSREANASDERDRVYGILGLPQISTNIHLLPNYNFTASETFILFSVRLFTSGSLNGLRLANSLVPSIGTRYWKSTHFSRPRSPKFIHGHQVIHHGCEHGLPSWVICWTCPRNPAQPFSNGSGSLPDFPTAAPPLISKHLLIASGIVFDSIATLSAFHATESDKSFPHNDPNPPSSPYGSRAATREALARTLLGAIDETEVSTPSAILHPKLWMMGIPGVDMNVFGLKDFYQRNRGLQLYASLSLTCLIFGDSEKDSRSLREKARAVPRFPPVTASHREALAVAMRRLGWRRLVTTRDGYLGLVPAATRAGDMVAVLTGCDVPLVLRPEVNSEQEGRFEVLGEAYVHWVTGRELGEGLASGRYTVREIHIC